MGGQQAVADGYIVMLSIVYDTDIRYYTGNQPDQGALNPANFDIGRFKMHRTFPDQANTS